jgi:ATP-dependent protease ClpP protease subunit
MKNQPLHVIQGVMKPYEAFWNVVNKANSESGETEIELFGPISEYLWIGDEITPKKFKNDLYENGAGGPVRIKVNSPGGEVVAANVIRSILQDYPGRVTADIVGMAASAATIVITGADQVIMREGALFMTHNPTLVAMGYATDLRKAADLLDEVKEGILNVYVSKTAKDRSILSDLMDKETWLSASEAKDYGFVDEVISGKSVKNLRIPANFVPGFKACLDSYTPLPVNVMNLMKSISVENEALSTNVPPVEQTSELPVDANALEIKRLGDFLDIFS